MSEAVYMDVAPLQVSDQNEKDSSVEQTTLEQTLELGCGSVCRKPSEQGLEGVQSEQGEIRSSGSIIVDEGGLRLCSEDVTKNVVAENSGPPAEKSKSIQNTTLLQESGEPSDMDVTPLQASDQNEKDSSREQTTLEQTLDLGCGSVCCESSEQGHEGVQSEQGEIRSSGSIIVDGEGLQLCSEDVTKNVVAENSGPPAEESKSIQNVKKSLDEPTTLLQGSGEPSDMDVTPLQASDQNEKDSSREQTTLEQTLDLGCGSVCCEPSEQGHEGVRSEQGEIRSSGSTIVDGEGLQLCSEDVTKNVVAENFVPPAEESKNIQNVKKSFDESTTLLQGSGEPTERKHQIGSELLPTAPVETSEQSEHKTQVASESELSDSTDDETWTVKETQGNVSSDSSDEEYRTDAIAPTKRKKRTGKVTLAPSKGNASILKDEAGRASKKRTRQKPKAKDPNGSPVTSDKAGRATKKRTCQKSKAKDPNGSPATSDKDSVMSRSSGKKASSSSNRRLGEAATQGLYKVFKNNQYPDRAMKEKLAAELGLTLQQVDKWFGNARWSFRHSSCVQPCSTVCPGSHPSRDKTPLTETPKTSTASSECSACESGKQ